MQFCILLNWFETKYHRSKEKKTVKLIQNEIFIIFLKENKFFLQIQIFPMNNFILMESDFQ